MKLLEYKKRCRKCGEYGGKESCGFYARSGSTKSYQETQHICKLCQSETARRYRQSECGKASIKKYDQSEARKARHLVSCKKYRESNKGKAYAKKYKQSEAYRLAEKKSSERAAQTLSDGYIKKLLYNTHGIPRRDASPETIKLARAQCETKRTLIQFKKWRSENEHTDHRND